MIQPKFSHPDQGFSLIELLVSLSIITMMIAMTMPALQGAREQARKQFCQSSVRQLAIAWAVYPSDHSNKLVLSLPDDQNGWVQRGPGWEPIEQGKLYPYIRTLDIWHCPSDGTGNERSYSIAAPLRGEHWDQHLTSPSHTWAQFGTDKVDPIINPSQQMLALEELDNRGWNMGSWIMYVRDSHKYDWIDYMATFHKRGTNISFADGHVDFWYWQDPDTLFASENGIFFLSDPGNDDWIRVRNAYRQLPGETDVLQTVSH